MKKEKIIDALIKERQFLKENYGVDRIALFGSYAKGLENQDSDVDLFVEFDKPNYSSLMGLYIYLEIKLNTKIDIVRNGPHLSKRFINTIKNELIYV